MGEAPARMRVSATKLSTWMTCPLQARFHYIDRLPSVTNAYAVFGRCVHESLALYNNNGGDLQAALDLFVDIWHDPDKIGSPIDVWPMGINYNGARERGINMLTGYHDKQQFEHRDIIAVEHPFLVPFGSYEIQGVVDLVEVKTSGKGKNILRTVDFKTNKKQPYRNALNINIQFTLYDYAIRQKEFWYGNGPDFPELPNGPYWYEFLKDLTKRGIWYQLENHKELDVGLRDEADYKRAYRICQQIERAQTHNVFVPNLSGDSCGFCPYQKECGLPVERFEIEDEDGWL